MGYVDAYCLASVPTSSWYDDEFNHADVRFFGFRFKVQNDNLMDLDNKTNCYLYGVSASIEINAASGHSDSTELSGDSIDEIVTFIAEWIREHGDSIYLSTNAVKEQIVKNAH